MQCKELMCEVHITWLRQLLRPLVAVHWYVVQFRSLVLVHGASVSQTYGIVRHASHELVVLISWRQIDVGDRIHRQCVAHVSLHDETASRSVLERNHFTLHPIDEMHILVHVARQHDLQTSVDLDLFWFQVLIFAKFTMQEIVGIHVKVAMDLAEQWLVLVAELHDHCVVVDVRSAASGARDDLCIWMSAV